MAVIERMIKSLAVSPMDEGAGQRKVEWCVRPDRSRSQVTAKNSFPMSSRPNGSWVCPLSTAASIGQRDTAFKSFSRRMVMQRLPGALIKPFCDMLG